MSVTDIARICYHVLQNSTVTGFTNSGRGLAWDVQGTPGLLLTGFAGPTVQCSNRWPNTLGKPNADANGIAFLLQGLTNNREILA